MNEQPDTFVSGGNMAKLDRNPKLNLGDHVARWDVPLSDGVHVVDFEHGTTSGKRVIYVDHKEIRREDFMFKLVGSEHFSIGKTKCCIMINAVAGFAYEYVLEVNGKLLEKFTEAQNKVLKCWITPVDSVQRRIVLEKDSLNVWVNGAVVETLNEFVDEGSEIHFNIDSHPAYIKTLSSGKRREGLVHYLIVDDVEIPEVPADQCSEWGILLFS